MPSQQKQIAPFQSENINKYNNNKADQQNKLRLCEIRVIHGCKINENFQLCFILEILNQKGIKFEVPKSSVSDDTLNSEAFRKFYAAAPFHSKSIQELEQKLFDDFRKKQKTHNIDIDDDDLMIKDHTKITSKSTYNAHKYPRTHIAFKKDIIHSKPSINPIITTKPSLRDRSKINNIKISNKPPIICGIKTKRKANVDSVRSKINAIKTKMNKHKKRKKKHNVNVRRSLRLQNIAPISSLTDIIPRKPPQKLVPIDKEKDISSALTRIQPTKPPTTKHTDLSKDNVTMLKLPDLNINDDDYNNDECIVDLVDLMKETPLNRLETVNNNNNNNNKNKKKYKRQRNKRKNSSLYKTDILDLDPSSSSSSTSSSSSSDIEILNNDYIPNKETRLHRLSGRKRFISDSDTPSNRPRKRMKINRNSMNNNNDNNNNNNNNKSNNNHIYDDINDTMLSSKKYALKETRSNLSDISTINITTITTMNEWNDQYIENLKKTQKQRRKLIANQIIHYQHIQNEDDQIFVNHSKEIQRFQDEIDKNKKLLHNHWNFWTSKQVLLWFQSIENDAFKITNFKQNIIENNICGKDLDGINDLSLRVLGINDIKTRKLILSNIDRLLSKNKIC